jgi:hypothetical protein
MKKNNILWIFLHPPRSGGTTFNDHLIKHFGKEAVFHMDYKGAIKELKNLSVKNRDKIKILVGHDTYYGIHRFFPERKIKYITFIRDPANQIISQYNYDLRRAKGLQIPFDKWYKSQLKNQLVHFYNLKMEGQKFTRVIYPSFLKTLADRLGIKTSSKLKLILKVNFSRKLATKFNSFKRKSPEGGREELANAKKILEECSFIAITENLENDLKLLCKELKIPANWERKGVSKKQFFIEEKIRKKLYEDNYLDLELYNYAKKLK